MGPIIETNLQNFSKSASMINTWIRDFNTYRSNLERFLNYITNQSNFSKSYKALSLSTDIFLHDFALDAKKISQYYGT